MKTAITSGYKVMDRAARISILRHNLSISKIKHNDQIFHEPTLKDAHVYCVINNLSAQQYGPLLENYIRTKFKYAKNKAEECTGDCSKDGKNSEIKVSLGGATHSKFNFVQIRPSHDCDTYVLTAYHLSQENVESEGELFIFRIPKEDMKTIILAHGGYAHGTLKEHGPITIDSLRNEKLKREYAIRPSYGDTCWNSLLPFRIQESAL
jgi:hypothetical protein